MSRKKPEDSAAPRDPGLALVWKLSAGESWQKKRCREPANTALLIFLIYRFNKFSGEADESSRAGEVMDISSNI
jgi:hypothetical protein